MSLSICGVGCPAAAAAEASSSPTKACVGNAARRRVMMAASAAASVEVTRSLEPDFSLEAWRACGSKAAAMMAPMGVEGVEGERESGRGRNDKGGGRESSERVSSSSY